MQIGAPFIANGQPPVLMDPGDGPLNNPAMPPQAVVGCDPFPGDADHDVSLAQKPPAAGDIVRLVGMDLGGALPAAVLRRPNRRDGINQRFKQDAVVAVRPAQASDEGKPMPIDGEMVFGPRFAPIDWVRPRLVAPFFAETLALSTLTRSQAMRSASPSRSRTT